LNARLVGAAVVIGLANLSPVGAAEWASGRFETISALAEIKLREYGVPGAAIGIIDNGIVTTRGFGITNVDDPLPVTVHTVFPVTSISKTFAATAMMRLVEQGKIDLQAPVRTYLPDFRVLDEKVSREVTVWNLLTHTSGWEGQVSGPDRGRNTLRDFVEKSCRTSCRSLLPARRGAAIMPGSASQNVLLRW
jgi:CubicO group peptidase (beta-lactamase class C family)